ncbi:MAG: ATP synthase F0 subunit A [Bacteroidetes bacterium]|nr:MAG: ATP synthase F0 subunit A [Bacteroidota bacterium]
MKAIFTILISVLFVFSVFAQHDDHNHAEANDSGHEENCGIEHHEVADAYNPGGVAFHHISDQNIFTIGPWYFNLPCILYAPEHGWSFFSSKKFHVHGTHGDGTLAFDGYVIHSGVVMRVIDASFPMGEVEVAGFKEGIEVVDGTEINSYSVCYNNELYKLDQESAVDGGLFKRGITSFYDFSITKNVLAMFIVALLLGWMFLSIAKSYRTRVGMAPKGIQSFIEPIHNFIRDDVAKAMIGPKYERYMPFIMSLFFFILALNLVGQIPFFGNPNVTGSLAFTIVLAVFTFVVTNLHGNANYWKHVFWMPGIPWPVKIILTPVEVMGVFLKPVTLTVRLFANITAGHIVLLSFIGLTFIFGDMGQSVGGGVLGAVVGVLLGIFMSGIELLVALLQAFIFAILSASYIGAAVADDH